MECRKDAEQDLTKMVGAKGFGWRHVQVLMLFLALTMTYVLRINISVCIIDMTDENSTSNYAVYSWTESERDLVLSSFFWGYIVTQVPAAILAQRYGPRWFLLLGVGGCSVLSALSPLVSAWGGWQLLCAWRILQGLVQGFIYPSSHTMLGRWLPPVERARWSAVVYNGIAVGTVISMAGTGELSGSALGWPSGFYVPGTVGIFWGVAWIILAADSPSSSKYISPSEKEYIERSLGDTSSGEEKLSVPWIKILSSRHMWAVITAHCGHNFGHWVLLTKLPAYMKSVLHFDIESNGLYSALPYIWLSVTCLFVSYISQVVNENKTCPINMTFSRKMFNTIGHWGSGTTMLILAFVKPSEGVAVLLLTIAVGFEAGTQAGFLVNHVDLSPNFAGSMMAVTNGLAAIVATVAPNIVGLITGDTSKLTTEEISSRWNIVFIVAACIYYVGNLIFVLLGSAEVQPWNYPKSHTDSKIQVPSDRKPTALKKYGA